MKRILITGTNSYIGTSFKKWVEKYHDEYVIECISVKDNCWREKSFREYDVVLHTAGIAHIKETPQNKDIYYKINRDLSVDIARKSKEDGVKQFIFLSTMSVYGMEQGIIMKDTKPNPKSNYGKSKYQAEKIIEKLSEEEFIVSIIRPPMVYGMNCKGNYKKLEKFVDKVRLFPYVTNERSMIYVENLCEFIRVIIDKKIKGVLYPQNKNYVCTSNMVRLVMKNKNKKFMSVPGLNKIIKGLSKKYIILSKVFGNLVYTQEMSDIGYEYQIFSFDESIKRSI